MQSQSFASRYLSMKRDKMAHGWALAKRNKGCYLFLAPYAILFITFFILLIDALRISCHAGQIDNLIADLFDFLGRSVRCIVK